MLQRIGRHRVYTHIISRAQRTHARYVEPARADQHFIYFLICCCKSGPAAAESPVLACLSVIDKV